MITRNLFFQPAFQHPNGFEADEYVQHLEMDQRVNYNGTSLTEGSKLIRKLVISGSGLMGCSIAASFLASDIPVWVYDISEESLRSFSGRIAQELSLQKYVSCVDIQTKIDKLLTITNSPESLQNCSVVIETIPEKLRIKQKHYRFLDSFCSNNALLLTNTSTIEINQLASTLKECQYFNAEHFCGFHFFHPVRKRSLVEIIRGAQTSSQTIAEAAWLAQQIHKTPIIVQDGPGFLVNRLLHSWLTESLTLLMEGVPMSKIESVCQKFGMEMGPFRIMDEIGLDVVLHGGWTLYKAFPDSVDPMASELLASMIQDGRLGRKNGRGFYRYQTVETQWLDSPLNDPDFEKLLEKERSRKKIFCQPELSEEMLIGRIILRILVEAFSIKNDEIVASFEDVDCALILGLGFPKNKGGLCFWIDSLPFDFREELKKIVSKVKFSVEILQNWLTDRSKELLVSQIIRPS